MAGGFFAGFYGGDLPGRADKLFALARTNAKERPANYHIEIEPFQGKNEGHEPI